MKNLTPRPRRWARSSSAMRRPSIGICWARCAMPIRPRILPRTSPCAFSAAIFAAPALSRKTIQRAQEKFAELLIEEVTTTLAQAGDVDVKSELHELDLLRFCKSALERREP